MKGVCQSHWKNVAQEKSMNFKMLILVMYD